LLIVGGLWFMQDVAGVKFAVDVKTNEDVAVA